MKIKNILFVLSTATLLATGATAWADSPSDLLEQGVYSEETKGDLDGAMQIYQKVIAQGKSDQALAAQAQYHLGVCYYKKQDFTAATAAFQTLIKDYPEQKDVIALAQKYLAGVNALQPAPWVDGEDLRLDLKLAGGLKIGIMDYRVSAGVETNGEKIWRINSLSAAGESQSSSQVEVQADTFSPIHSYWRHTLLGAVDAVYYADHADLTKAGSDEVKKIPFDQPVIDNESAIEMMRRLPLTNGYTTTQLILSSLGSRTVPVTLNVTGPESVTVPAGTFDCYKVSLSIGQDFWYSADAKRYLVKLEAGGAIAELTTISQHSPGEKAAYSDTNWGFSVTAPAGWLFFEQSTETNKFMIIGIVDPKVLAVTTLGVRNLSSLKPSETNSVRAYADYLRKEEANNRKDFKTRADSWKDHSVAGQPGLSYVSDYTDRDKAKVTYTVCSLIGTNGVVFVMSASPEDLARLQPKLDAIINSFQMQ